MLVVEIIQKIRKNNKIDELVLKDATGMFIVSYDKVCEEVEAGNLTVLGYTVVRNGDSLELKESECTTEVTTVNDSIVVDRDLIDMIEQNTKLAFKTVNNISEELLRFNGEVSMISQNCFIEMIDDTINVVSDKKFRIVDGYELFQDKQFKAVDLSNVDMTEIKTAERMFEGCAIRDLLLTCGCTSQLKSTKAMFMNSKIYSLAFKSIQTKNVEDMSYMFCNSTIGKFRTYRSTFNTQNVVDMTKMFFRCSNDTIKNAKVDSFNISSLLSADFMFSKCDAETVDISKWNITDILSMKGCFSGANIDTLVVNKESLPDSPEMFVNATIKNM